MVAFRLLREKFVGLWGRLHGLHLALEPSGVACAALEKRRCGVPGGLQAALLFEKHRFYGGNHLLQPSSTLCFLELRCSYRFL